MKKGTGKYTKPPGSDVLEDIVVSKIRSSDEFSQRTSQLSFQLEYLYRNWQLCIELWDGETIDAWKEVGGLATALLQRALVRDIIMLCCQLCDDLNRSSSIKSLHKKCIHPHLKSGSFKSYYMPLYEKILKQYEPFKDLRDTMLAHQDQEWLAGKLGPDQQNQKTQETDGSFRNEDLRNLITLLSCYVNLCNLIGDRPIKEYGAEASNMEGVAGIRKALIDAYQQRRANKKVPRV